MTLAEFEAWGLKEKSVANPPPNNKYKGQCVSLIQQYLYRVFGKPFKAYGNAKDWANNYPKDYFKKLQVGVKLEPGDVLVYGASYGGGYGHIGIIGANGNFYDQNGVKKLAIGYRSAPFRGYVCVLRPINQEKLGLDNKSSFSVGKTYTLQVNLKVRKGPGTNSEWKLKSELTADGQKNALNQKNAVLKKGTRVTVQQVIKQGNDIWLKIPSGYIAGVYNQEVYVK